MRSYPLLVNRDGMFANIKLSISVDYIIIGDSRASSQAIKNLRCARQVTRQHALARARTYVHTYVRTSIRPSDRVELSNRAESSVRGHTFTTRATNVRYNWTGLRAYAEKNHAGGNTWDTRHFVRTRNAQDLIYRGERCPVST